MKKPKDTVKIDMIAPCGMNCGICYGRLRKENQCVGCRNMKENGSKYCRKCIIKNCEKLVKLGLKYCSDKCPDYPCKRLKALDKRYRDKYEMSMIENLEFIDKKGIRKFVKDERKRWECKHCGGVINVHHKICHSCGRER